MWPNNQNATNYHFYKITVPKNSCSSAVASYFMKRQTAVKQFKQKVASARWRPLRNVLTSHRRLLNYLTPKLRIHSTLPDQYQHLKYRVRCRHDILISEYLYIIMFLLLPVRTRRYYYQLVPFCYFNIRNWREGTEQIKHMMINRQSFHPTIQTVMKHRNHKKCFY